MTFTTHCQWCRLPMEVVIVWCDDEQGDVEFAVTCDCGVSQWLIAHRELMGDGLEYVGLTLSE